MAFGVGTVNSISGAVADLFNADAHKANAQAHRYKAQGQRIEAGNYDRSSDFSEQNAMFTETSTAIKRAQTDRDLYKTLGGQQSDIAGAGFANTGTALDLMRDSAAQGALTKAVGAQQGLITEEGYQVQAKNYIAMGEAARLAASAEDAAAAAEEHAAKGSQISSIFKGVAAIASVFDVGGITKNVGNLFMGGGSPTGYGS